MDYWVIVFIITIGYLVLSLLIGLLSGRKTSANPESYVAGNRTIGFLVLYFIMGSSIFSAFAFLGGPGWAYSRGAAAQTRSKIWLRHTSPIICTQVS